MEIDWLKTILLLLPFLLLVPIIVAIVAYSMGRTAGYRYYVSRYRHMKPTGINRPRHSATTTTPAMIDHYIDPRTGRIIIPPRR
jgi:hypothetical protein